MIRRALFAASFLSAAPVWAGGVLPEPLDSLALDGFRAMYRLEFSTAEARFQQMTREAPRHPSGWVFLSSMYWWQYSQDFESPDRAVEDLFWKAALRGVEVAEAYSESASDKVEADFWRGGIYGIIGRWHVSEWQFIRAYFRGNKGYKLLRDVVKRDPAFYDAYLGVGQFEYLAAKLPGIIRLPALLLVRGDREGGIRAVTVAAEQGRYGVWEAKAFLAAVYSEHERDYPTALRWADGLLGQDPGNPWFRMARALLLFYNKDYGPAEAETLAATQEVAGIPGHPLERLLPMGYYNLGNIRFARRDFEGAVEWYTKGTQTAFRTKGWGTYCYLRRAQAYDQLGRRAEALADYEVVLARKNFWDSVKYAKQGRKSPQPFDAVLEQMIPPPIK